MYVENVYNYFHDFRTAVKYATIKIEITIENGRSLKLRPTRPKVELGVVLHINCQHETDHGRRTPSPSMGSIDRVEEE